MTLRHGSPDVDAMFAAEQHVTDTLRKHFPASQPVPIKNMIASRGLREVERLLGMYAEECHGLREPKAAAALEGVSEVVQETRAELEGRK